MARLIIGKGIKFEVPLEQLEPKVDLETELKKHKILNVILSIILGITLALHLI